MLASGLPIVATAAPGTGIAAEIEGCGQAVEPGNTVDLAMAIERLCDDPALARTLGRAARHRAEAHWCRKTILADFVRAIETAERADAAAMRIEAQGS